MLTSFPPVHSAAVGRTMTNVLSRTTGKHPKCILAIHWICVHRMSRNRTTSQNHRPTSIAWNRTTRQNHHPRRKEEKKEATDGPTSKQKRRYKIIIAKIRVILQNRRRVPASEVRTWLLMCFIHCLICSCMHCRKFWRVRHSRYKSSRWRTIDVTTSAIPGNVTSSRRWSYYHLRRKRYSWKTSTSKRPF